MDSWKAERLGGCWSRFAARVPFHRNTQEDSATECLPRYYERVDGSGEADRRSGCAGDDVRRAAVRDAWTHFWGVGSD